MILAIIDLLGALSESEGYDLSFKTARSRADAEERVRNESMHLVITALEIAADTQSRLGAGEQRRLGMELVGNLRANNLTLPAIIVTDHVDDAVYDFTQSAGTRLAREGEKFADNLKLAVTQLLSSDRQEKPGGVVLSISLSKDRARCSYQFQSVGGLPRTAHLLDIDQKRLDALVEQSRDVHVGDHTWEGELRRVGEALADGLFDRTPANLEFRDEFNQWVGKVGIENIRVRFTVEDLLHPIAVEALKQEKDDQYWMLRTAVFRGQEPLGGGPENARPGLFQDEATKKGPINFLIIDADTPANAIVKEGALDLTLKPLPKLEDEVKALDTLLSNLREAGRPIGEVRVIRPADVPAEGSFKALVETVLKKKDTKWHVLHYAGHTHYDARNQVGYLFFPRGGIRPVEAVKIAEFALWLSSADTRFVFLSSCESAGQDFIYHLAKERVPAIMGFLWKVDDTKAREYAESFYEYLFDGGHRSLEYACLGAKKEMHAKYSDNPIWASPVLVMQVSV